jgi:hypothetical protein
MVKDKSNGAYKINFRCPFCGDSEKSKYKTRGWIFESKGRLHYKCFNCGIAPPFGKVLEHLNQPLYREYCVEKFKREPMRATSRAEPAKSLPVEKTEFKITGAHSIRELSDLHPAKRYVTGRQIPDFIFDDVYYVEEFFKWVNETLVADKFKVKRDEPRIVFTLRRRDGSVFGIQGRSLDPDSTLRYVTVRTEDTDDPKIFGMNRWDPTKPTYVVEGPIDSLFLPNCLAMVGSEARLDSVVNKELTTVVFDCEPRNREIVANVNKYILDGWRVCVWPENFKHKDINDAVKSGMTPDEVERVIASNSYSGLTASLKMKYWSRV